MYFYAADNKYHLKSIFAADVFNADVMRVFNLDRIYRGYHNPPWKFIIAGNIIIIRALVDYRNIEQ